MKSIKSYLVATTITVLLFACQKNIKDDQMQDEQVSKSVEFMNAMANKGTAGYVYTLSNQVSGNSVLVYSRNAAGIMSYLTSYATGGTGTGGGLGNQGAIVLSDDNSVLLAVNAGSNSVTSFLISGGSLVWKSTVSSNGITPVSVAVHNDLVYVLNAGGSGNISGFRLHADATLHAISGSTKPLSSSGAGAAQVSFVVDGNVLVITEKATNKIITYTVNAEGKPDVMHSIMSSTPTPFGFAVGKENIIYVSEAVGGAPNVSALSSYSIGNNGVIELVDGSVGAGQTAACWVVITNNGKYVYDTNTGSGNLSSYSTSHGDLDVLEAIAGVTGAGSSPTDAALSNNSRFLYILNSGNETISVFSVGSDGGLSSLQTVNGLPDGATGMAAK